MIWRINLTVCLPEPKITVNIVNFSGPKTQDPILQNVRYSNCNSEMFMDWQLFLIP